MSGSTPFSPDRMTAAERLAEVGRILALGILRARDRQLGRKVNNLNEMGDVSLDFRDAQRGHVSTKQRRGETA